VTVAYRSRDVVRRISQQLNSGVRRGAITLVFGVGNRPTS
jgi:hypothetical protein